MRVRKYKRFHHFIHTVYEKGFNFRQPYQIIGNNVLAAALKFPIVDAEFCREALRKKIDIKETLPLILGGNAKPMSTQCVMDELRRTEREDSLGASYAARHFEMRRCRHSPALSPAECIKALVGIDNPNKYGVAAQSQELRVAIRAVAGVPLIFISHGTMILEEPSKDSRAIAHMKELAKIKPSKAELDLLKKELPLEKKAYKLKRKKKVRGPNPLSVKKKTKREGTAKIPARNQKNIKDGAAKDHTSDHVKCDELLPKPVASSPERTAPTSHRRKRKRKHRRSNPTTSTAPKTTAVS